MEVTKTMVSKVKTLKKSWMSFKMLGKGSQKPSPKWWLKMVIQSYGIIRKTSPKNKFNLLKEWSLRTKHKKSKSLATKIWKKGTGDFRPHDSPSLAMCSCQVFEEEISMKFRQIHRFLVGGFNPSEKY